MKGRLPLVLSLVALVVAVTGFTGLGEAARDALPRASFANNSTGSTASTPRGGREPATCSPSAKPEIPASVIGTGPAGRQGQCSRGRHACERIGFLNPQIGDGQLSRRQEVIAGGARAAGPATRSRDRVLPEQRHAVDGAGEEQRRRAWMLTTYAVCAIVRRLDSTEAAPSICARRRFGLSSPVPCPRPRSAASARRIPTGSR